MKKRLLCLLMALLMAASLIPTAALSASAATLSVSESAIFVLKQLEGYSRYCDKNGYIGYGTPCDGKGDHGKKKHEVDEIEADKALREALKDLDKAVNSFASKKGLSLTQGQHDAMVLFSFQNGTAWTTGTGDLQSAIANKAKGSEFLSAICRWNASQDDDERRMIEANMYLNGVYSSSVPSQFIWVELNAKGGTMSQAAIQYYDVSTAQPVGVIPTYGDKTFMGWYLDGDGHDGTVVTKVTKDHAGETLYARWQDSGKNMTGVYYTITLSDLASRTIYKAPNGDALDTKIDKYIGSDGKTLTVYADYVDKDGVRWCVLGHGDGDKWDWQDWVKLKTTVTGGIVANTSGLEIDVTVTVTNSYVNSRVNATIFSARNGSYKKGDKLRIINTANADGFLWGQVAASSEDATPVAWVALMYTDFESVKDSGSSNQNTTNVVARAVVTTQGYLNVRNDAGTDNQIVGALAKGTQVDLYETKYVNGIQWGRYSGGWICLAYTNVTRVTEDTGAANDVGLTAYAFTGVMHDSYVYDKVNGTGKAVDGLDGKTVTVTNLTADEDGNTWGKISEGWIPVTRSNGEAWKVDLDVAKFYVVADAVSVRNGASAGADLVDTLSKGVEFNVNDTYQVVVVGETIWGYADKVGEGNATYGGWVNLASKYVSRNGAPDLNEDKDDEYNTYTGQLATVVNTDSVNVRITGATYGKIVGKLARGTTARVLGERDGWYNLDVDVDGDPETGNWVSGSYLNVYEGTIDGSGNSNSDNNNGTSGGNSKVETGTGIVANTYAGVNVRSGAGIGYALVGKLLPGTSVEITEVKQVGAAKWGKIAQGWVCMDYITMVSNYPIGGGSGSGSSGATTTEVAIYTGQVKDGVGSVTVYKETSTSSDAVRTLNERDPVTVHELLTSTETTTTPGKGNSGSDSQTVTKTTYYWARVNDGYIQNPQKNLTLDALDEKTYTLTEKDSLNAFTKAAGSEKVSELKLKKGDQVKVTSLQIVKGNVWGRIEKDGYTGWISLASMTPGAVTIAPETSAPTTAPSTPTMGSTGNTGSGGFVTNTGGYKYTGKVINTNELNVRSTASTASTITTTLKGGASLVIYETTISENMAWGRCDAGWVYLYYVDLTPCINGAVDARVVYQDNTIIYTDANGSATAGTYAKMSVIDIYEIVGKMARTDLGWVNTDNLL